MVNMPAGGRRGAAAPCYLNESKVKVKVWVWVKVKVKGWVIELRNDRRSRRK
jgi:hypothetical protein